jgi:hypothetical protein
MTDAPTAVSDEQLEELHVRLAPTAKAGAKLEE